MAHVRARLHKNKKEKVFNSLINGDLKDVIEAYKKYPEIQKLKIPRTGDTALHVAISDELYKLAETMVMESRLGTDVLAIRNNQGDTALHLAAKFGNAYLCKCIAVQDARLVGVRNDFGETPLFSAVSHGMTEAFLYLHHFCRAKSRLRYGSYTSKNGDTILHSAIDEQHFDLAYIIIGEYPELVHELNEDGFSPLHLLATKSSAFPSGLYVSGIPKLIYHCIRAQKLEQIPDLSSRPIPKPNLNWFEWIYYILWTSFEARLHFLEHESTKTELGHGEIDQEDDDEEAANEKECHWDIDQQDEEEAANEVDDNENLERDETTTNRKVNLIRMGPWELCTLFGVIVCLPFIVVYYAFRLLRLTYKLAKFTLGYERLKHLKERCIWSVEVMNKLIPHKSKNAYRQGGIQAGPSKGETPILIAARNGMSEMVLRILDVNPWAKHDVNTENKNIVMLAVEHRHPRLYEDLMTNLNYKKTIFGQVDTAGNSLLHLAANFKAGQYSRHLRGAAFHMQMEIKWYKFIKKSMPPRFFARCNNVPKTPKEIFRESHQDLIKEGREWLTDTSQSCSLVAALIATVAFATSATIPGGLKQDNGVPSLEHKPIFIISASSSLVALSSSMISVVMFLGILTSNFKLKDFREDLPYKLLLGLLSLLISIVSMFISFFAGHYFVLKQEFNHIAIIVYALMCFLLLVFIILKFPLSFDMVGTTLRTKPRN